MSGKNLSAVAILLALLCAAASAQSLPKLPQVEMENFRLALLDAKNTPQGSLEGKLASSKRDGTVEIQGAVLTVLRGQSKLVARAEKFIYTPGTDAFDCPEGMEAELPGGGHLSAPAAKGTLVLGDEPVLTFACKGTLIMRSGAKEASALRSAEIIDPDVEVRITEMKADPTMSTLKAKGTRGGSLQLRVATAPALDGRFENKPALLALSCFGDIDVDLAVAGGTGSISLLRRARMALVPDVPAATPALPVTPKQDEQPDKPFEIKANLLRIRGKLTEQKQGQPATGLTGLEIDGTDAVQVSGPRFSGFADQLEYREVGLKRIARLIRSPILDLVQTPKEAVETKRAMLRMKARELISLSSEASPDTQPAMEIAIESGAQMWREIGAHVQWHLVGRRIGLTTHLEPKASAIAKEDADWRVDMFSVVSEGYSPMLRVAGMSKISDTDIDPGQRAAVFGARTEGTVDADGVLRATVTGPDILAMLYDDHSLADEMRYALRLRKRPEDHDPPAPRQPRPGRMEVRAANTLELEMATQPVRVGEEPRPMAIKATGNVRMEHTPLPRNDRDLVTLGGEGVWLVFGGVHVADPMTPDDKPARDGEPHSRARLQRADLTPAPRGDCLATMGYDLLLSHGFSFAANEQDKQQHLGGIVTGPGRMVIRDKESLESFRRLVERLPRRAPSATQQAPDAGWMDFGADLTLTADADARTFDARLASFHLAFGDFQEPRGGQSALKDLADLLEPDVRQLYFVRAKRLLIVSSGHAAPEETRAVVNLLRLEGDALVRSHVDGLAATATESIEATGADDQRSPGNPLAVVLLGSPEIVMDRADTFFGEVVTRGAFAYDGRWHMRAGERLEITFRPLAVGDPGTLGMIRGDLASLSVPETESITLAMRASRSLRMMRELAALLPPEHTPETEQARTALRYTESAAIGAARCCLQEATGGPDYALRERVARYGRRAHDLLGGLVDVAAMGGVRGEFSSLGEQTPPLNLEMQRIIVSFNGLGEIVDTRGEGPVRITRSAYTITGGALTQARDGTLLLDNAAITLPPDTGVQISGITRVSLRQVNETAADGAETRTMVTRVSGKGLKVSINLSKKPD